MRSSRFQRYAAAPFSRGPTNYTIVPDPYSNHEQSDFALCDVQCPGMSCSTVEYWKLTYSSRYGASRNRQRPSKSQLLHAAHLPSTSSGQLPSCRKHVLRLHRWPSIRLPQPAYSSASISRHLPHRHVSPHPGLAPKDDANGISIDPARCPLTIADLCLANPSLVSSRNITTIDSELCFRHCMAFGRRGVQVPRGVAATRILSSISIMEFGP